MPEPEMKVSVISQSFVDERGIYKLEEALNWCAKIGGICYSTQNIDDILNEDIEKTTRRKNMTLNLGHHSIYEHAIVSLYIEGLPKILAMILNNEHQYTTSERSFRYTPATKQIVNSYELDLYNKWMKIFFQTIKKEYNKYYTDKQIEKLSQENSRYLTSIFTKTQMIYTVNIRQLNYVASWMEKYIELSQQNLVDAPLNLVYYMQLFISQLRAKNLLDDKLMKNEKNRQFSLFHNDNLTSLQTNVIGNNYSTVYQASAACLAQLQRHRTINYEMDFTSNYFIPPIIENDEALVKMWYDDINSVEYPQGQLLQIKESGTIDNLILRSKERSCINAQLEIRRKNLEILKNVYEELKKTDDKQAKQLEQYIGVCRNCFPDYNCSVPCHHSKSLQKIKI
ncbi:MAG: FAD-dependent thymidylate synthase [bacterium]|nr:FAD-dependent thymidylate synthase [bacterium]